MGNTQGTSKKKKEDKSKKREDDDNSDDEDSAAKMAEAAWKETKGARPKPKGHDDPDSDVEEQGQSSHPKFLDGKGKLWDQQGKRWIAVKQEQGRRASAGVEHVNKTYPSGNKYEGAMLDGKYHGQGRLEYADRRRYDGEWYEGAMHGKGTFHYANGDVYAGEYFGGKQQGKGTFTWKNGDQYVGEWKNGKRHGKGCLKRVCGDGFNGTWTKGAPDMQILKNNHR